MLPFLAMQGSDSAYEELYVYTMGRPGFILQHVVDAFVVQSATQDTKPIAVVFGLIGLYLHLEKHLDGREVQKMHMQLGWRKREWPRIALPEDRGSIRPADVLAKPVGPERDQAIDDWCKSVWDACAASRQTIISLLQECSQ